MLHILQDKKCVLLGAHLTPFTLHRLCTLSWNKLRSYAFMN